MQFNHSSALKSHAWSRILTLARTFQVSNYTGLCRFWLVRSEHAHPYYPELALLELAPGFNLHICRARGRENSKYALASDLIAI